jgi:hypothetical protein
MQYKDVAVGQELLYSHYRASNRHFRITDAKRAVVLKTGMQHSYEVRTGGWNGGHERRTTNQGILLRITRNFKDRKPRITGETDLLPEVYEGIAITAQLRPFEGESKRLWTAAREREVLDRETAEILRVAQADVIGRFNEQGFSGVTFAGADVVIPGAQVTQLLGLIEGAARGKAD